MSTDFGHVSPWHVPVTCSSPYSSSFHNPSPWYPPEYTPPPTPPHVFHSPQPPPYYTPPTHYTSPYLTDTSGTPWFSTYQYDIQHPNPNFPLTIQSYNVQSPLSCFMGPSVAETQFSHGLVFEQQPEFVALEVFDESPESPVIISGFPNSFCHQTEDKLTEILEKIGKNLAESSRIIKEMSSKWVSPSSHVSVVDKLDNKGKLERTMNCASVPQLDISARRMFDESPAKEFIDENSCDITFEAGDDKCESSRETVDNSVGELDFIESDGSDGRMLALDSVSVVVDSVAFENKMKKGCKETELKDIEGWKMLKFGCLLALDSVSVESTLDECGSIRGKVSEISILKKEEKDGDLKENREENALEESENVGNESCEEHNYMIPIFDGYNYKTCILNKNLQIKDDLMFEAIGVENVMFEGLQLMLVENTARRGAYTTPEECLEATIAVGFRKFSTEIIEVLTNNTITKEPTIARIVGALDIQPNDVGKELLHTFDPGGSKQGGQASCIINMLKEIVKNKKVKPYEFAMIISACSVVAAKEDIGAKLKKWRERFERKIGLEGVSAERGSGRQIANDGSFFWCNRSQVKSHAKNFKGMFKQSNSKNFMYVVEAALDQVGRVMKLEMICSCAAGINGKLDASMTSNNGFEVTLLVHVDVGKSVIAQYELTGNLKNHGETVFMKNMLMGLLSTSTETSQTEPPIVTRNNTGKSATHPSMLIVKIEVEFITKNVNSFKSKVQQKGEPDSIKRKSEYTFQLIKKRKNGQGIPNTKSNTHASQRYAKLYTLKHVFLVEIQECEQPVFERMHNISALSQKPGHAFDEMQKSGTHIYNITEISQSHNLQFNFKEVVLLYSKKCFVSDAERNAEVKRIDVYGLQIVGRTRWEVVSNSFYFSAELDSPDWTLGYVIVHVQSVEVVQILKAKYRLSRHGSAEMEKDFLNRKEWCKSISFDRVIAYHDVFQITISSDEANKVQELIRLDVTPLSPGIGTRSVAIAFILINTTLPTKKKQVLPIDCDDQPLIMVHVYKCERTRIKSQLLGM